MRGLRRSATAARSRVACRSIATASGGDSGKRPARKHRLRAGEQSLPLPGGTRLFRHRLQKILDRLVLTPFDDRRRERRDHGGPLRRLGWRFENPL